MYVPIYFTYIYIYVCMWLLCCFSFYVPLSPHVVGVATPLVLGTKIGLGGVIPNPDNLIQFGAFTTTINNEVSTWWIHVTVESP